MEKEKMISADGDFFDKMREFEREVIEEEAPEYLEEYDREMQELNK